MTYYEKWIGPEDNISGSYWDTKYKPLQKRSGGKINALEMYVFRSGYDALKQKEYYITDPSVIQKLKALLEKEDIDGIESYLYMLVIERFGIKNFIDGIEEKIKVEKNKSKEEGKREIQKQFRHLMGIER